MEHKKSVVTAVTGNGTWESPQYGMFYKHEVAFENGDVGEYSSKDQHQSKFVVGQEAEYTLTSAEYNGNTYYRVKPAQPQGGYSGGGKFGGGGKADPERELRIVRQTCMKAGVDLICHDKVSPSEFWNTIQGLVDYCMDGKLPTQTGKDLPF